MLKECLLELVNVRKSYASKGKEVDVLSGVNLAVHEGDFILIMGPSGSGKSTMLNMMGLLDTPSHGDIYLNSQQANGLREKEKSRLRANTIGFVFQEFHLFPNLNVLENVTMPLLLQKEISLKDRIQRARELLELVGVSHRTEHMPQSLSGGEKQRVSIARALAASPKLLLADEPTGNVDAENELHLIEVFQKLTHTGVSVVVVSHNPVYKEFVDRAYHLNMGSLLEEEVCIHEAQ